MCADITHHSDVSQVILQLPNTHEAPQSGTILHTRHDSHLTTVLPNVANEITIRI